jgi:hypothetical protein
VLASLTRADGSSKWAKGHAGIVRDEIKELFSERWAREHCELFLSVEEALLRDALICYTDGTLPPASPRDANTDSLVGKLVYEGHTPEQIEAVGQVLAVYRNALNETKPFVRSRWTAVWQKEVQQPLSRDLRNLLVKQKTSPILDGTVTSLLELSARRHLAAAALGLSRYRAEHDGAWPESLDQLVPTVLPNVPADALSADPAALHYRAAAPRALWSAGDDGVSHGGVFASEGMTYDQRRKTDIVFPLESDAHRD